jgi:hypothetical protein
MHVAFVDNVKITRRQCGQYFLLDGILNGHVDFSLPAAKPGELDLGC